MLSAARIRSFSFRCGTALGVLALAGVSIAHAQTKRDDSIANENQSEEPGDAKEIIVTGTLVRGVAPAGTNVISIDQTKLEEAGVTSTARIVEQLPQFNTGFNSFQAPSGAAANVALNRPNLRSLPGSQASGSATTLVLMDGARIVGMGINSSGSDMDIVAPGAIARTEIVPDGGSALYGSDAVAGVINLGTRQDYDGAEISARSGFTGAYHSFDVDATVGKKWSNGSAYLSYSFAQNNALRGYALDFVQQQPATDANFPGRQLLSLNCEQSNVVYPATTAPAAPAVSYAQPYTPGAGVAGTLNQCDTARQGTIYPAQTRHSALAGVTQQLTDTIRLDVRGVYLNRLTESPGTYFRPASKSIVGTAVQGSIVSPLHAANQPVLGAPATQRNIVYFQFGAENASRSENRLEAWQITPKITADLGGTWQLRLHGTYGWSKLETHGNGFNDTALNNAIIAGLFNPYNPSLSDAATVAAISNYDNYGRGIQTLQNVRAVFDGDLFTLPGGAVKVAFGGEFIRETLENQYNASVWRGTENSGFAGLNVGQVVSNAPANIASLALIPANNPIRIGRGNRSVWAAFGEVVVPIFSDENAIPGFQALTVSIAGRLDRYSDVGSTFNPKFGLTWKPTEWLTFRAAYGTSFNAPSLADTPALVSTNVNNLTGLGLTFLGYPGAAQQIPNGGTYPAPGLTPVGTQQHALSISGVNANIKPQTAKSLSLGVDIEPPFLEGLRLSGTYYQLRFDNQIGLPLSPYINFPQLIELNPTAARIQEVLALAQTPVVLSCVQQGCVYAIIQSGLNNLGDSLIRGVDFSARYRRETGFGSFDINVSGSHDLHHMRSQFHGGPLVTNALLSTPLLRLSTSIGVNIGDFGASANWRHTSGYDLVPAVGSFAPFQTHVDGFDTVDLFFKYNWPKSNFSLTLNVNNVLNARPPFSQANSGYTNGQTYGRMAQVGFSKKF